MKEANMGDSKIEATTENRQAEDEQKELASRDFAAEVKRLRNRIGMSQKRLGALIGVEQTIMARIEAGTYGITLDLVSRLAEALHEDRHKLADIYWGAMPEDNTDPNKELLDTIWSLLANFYQPHLPPLTENKTQISEKGEKALNKATAARRKKKIDKPADNNP